MGALAIGEFFTAPMITAFVLVADGIHGVLARSERPRPLLALDADGL